MNSTNKHNKPLTREDISQYMSSQDQRVKHNIERKSQRSDFEAEALEGWAAGSVPVSSMKRLDKRFTSSGRYFLATAVSVVILGGFITIWLLTPFGETPTSVPEQSHTVTLNVEKTDLVLPEVIDTMIAIPSNEAIPAKRIQEEFKAKTASPAIIDQSEKNVKSDLKVEQLPLLKVDIPKKPERSLTTVTAKEIYLFDLKLVDYRSYRNQPFIRTESIGLTGVPANLEDEYSLSEEAEWREINIPYIDYLKKTTGIFSKENYKQALSRYLTILESYPDDVNALFYSGLCYYNLNQHTAAIEQFHQCLRSGFDNFYEESEWLLARSYEADGQLQKAQSIYRLIVSKKGYYASQAKKNLGE